MVDEVDNCGAVCGCCILDPHFPTLSQRVRHRGSECAGIVHVPRRTHMLELHTVPTGRQDSPVRYTKAHLPSVQGVRRDVGRDVVWSAIQVERCLPDAVGHTSDGDTDVAGVGTVVYRLSQHLTHTKEVPGCTTYLEDPGIPEPHQF